MGDLYLPESDTKVNRLVQPFHLRGGSPIHLRKIEVEFLPWTDRVEALSFHSVSYTHLTLPTKA